MNDLSKQILGIGNQMKDGILSEDEGRKALDELRNANHLSRQDVKKVVRPVINKMRADVDAKQRQIDELMMEKNSIEKLKMLEHLVKDDSRPPSVLIRYFKDAFPSVWSMVAQRIYKHVDVFGNYQLAYLEWGWAHVLRGWKSEVNDPLTENHRDALDTFDLHEKHGFPFFFVSQGICDAAWQSDLTFAIDWETMHLPFEAFTFVLPKTNPVGCEAVIVYRRNNKMTFVTLGNAGMGEEIIVEHPFEAADDEESNTVRWVFNTIYAMSARPEYVEGGERVGRYKSTESEVWTPNIVGRKYAVKSHSFSNQSSRSVRLHWRRGHFRQQAFGVGRSQHKVIWIEPMMVGGH